MCGIFVVISGKSEGQLDEYIVQNVNRKICRRGPNSNKKISTCKCNKIVEIHATVLHLRGLTAVTQPLEDDNGNLLLWNGEIFDGIPVPDGTNDGLVLLNRLQNCNKPKEIIFTLSSIQGPWALVYWQEKYQKLWFGRDLFGRRSLIWKLPLDAKDHFVLSSVATRPAVDSNYKWREVTPGIYNINMAQWNDHLTIEKFPWKNDTETVPENTTSNLPVNQIEYCNIHISEILAPNPVKIPLNITEPTEEILSVCYPRLDLQNSETTNLFAHLYKIPEFSTETAKFADILGEAVRKRVQNLPRSCKKCEETVKSCQHAKVAVLFSGGLDSTVLCALADRFTPQEEPIDLFNVAFQQRVPNSYPNFQVPDRISGIQALNELRILNPNRDWNFVEANVTKDELDKSCEEHVWDLVYPLDTVLDSDIGASVWFAAKGKGTVSSPNGSRQFESNAKVVLTGMGADEQLGGYSRHRIRFCQNGWKGLVEELHMEMARISYRNLGRDDRVISDHGREARFPFLDENVVGYLNSLPIWLKVNPTLPRGIGDKILLRLMAYDLGLHKTSHLAKRAIQFGSRIAKLEKGRKGTDNIDKLTVKTVTI